MERVVKRIAKVILTLICTTLIISTATISKAAGTDTPPVQVIPTNGEHFELNAVEVKDIAGQNKQVIMELWGYDVDFKRSYI